MPLQNLPNLMRAKSINAASHNPKDVPKVSQWLRGASIREFSMRCCVYTKGILLCKNRVRREADKGRLKMSVKKVANALLSPN